MKEFKARFLKMSRMLSEINKHKTRGMDVSVVRSAFMRLCDEVDTSWSRLTEEEKSGFEIADQN